MTAFDFIIVGAGSAGCVLADRLTACGRYSVLLLEAGGSDNRFWLRVPIGYGKSFFDPAVNWMYRTEPDAALAGRAGYWPRGKVLGGSSSINAMVFVRGQPSDFDDWAANGNAGWSWDDVLPWFRKLEDSARGSPLRGRGGPMTVTHVSTAAHPLCSSYLQAGVENGQRISDDLNGEQAEGVGLYEITTRHGVRASASSAYLRPAVVRANLEVRTDALATQVIFEGKRATGVRFRHGGHEQTARARREVIVCAGAVNSPQLLMLSGVGPADDLQALGIPLIAELPQVGRNLQDHLCIDHLYRASAPSLNNALAPWHGKLWAGMQYVLARRGPLALSINQAGGFVRSRAGLTRPNLQLYFSPLSYTRPTPGRRALMEPDPEPGFLLGAQPCRPTSRGRIRLRSADPAEAPRIEPNSLSTPEDLRELVEASQYLRTFAAAPALQAVIDHELLPGPQLQSREQLEEDVRQRASTVFHPVSTCRMGASAVESVLDNRLRVHGLQGLRVIDASAFPSITSGNTNAPTLMLAEKGASLVLQDHESPAV